MNNNDRNDDDFFKRMVEEFSDRNKDVCCYCFETAEEGNFNFCSECSLCYCASCSEAFLKFENDGTVTCLRNCKNENECKRKTAFPEVQNEIVKQFETEEEKDDFESELKKRKILLSKNEFMGEINKILTFEFGQEACYSCFKIEDFCEGGFSCEKCGAIYCEDCHEDLMQTRNDGVLICKECEE